MPPSFDLIKEPFIPCLVRDGPPVEYSLRQTLIDAHNIAEIRDESPLVTIALHRLLLAILHRCYQGPRKPADRVAIWKAGMFSADRINAYLENGRCADRFDLFHEKYPFYQRAGFTTKEPSGINRLAQELSRGNNAVLFDHTTDNPPPALSPARAARVIIAEQAFAVSGGKSDTGNTTHAPLVSGAVVLVRGNNLFETLWLNLTIFSSNEPVPSLPDKDAPVWESPPAEPHKERSQPRGYLDYLTWQSRTLRLHPEEENGQLIVRRVSYAQGRKLETGTGFFDPMIAFFRRDTKDAFLPVRFNEFRDLWRDSAALFQVSEKHQRYDRAPTCLRTLTARELKDVLHRSTPHLSVFGLCTDKAKINFWRHETLPLPLAYLDRPELVGSLKAALRLAERVAWILKAATYEAVVQIKKDLLPAKPEDATRALKFTEGNDRSPKRRPDPLGNRVKSLAPERNYWARLEPDFRIFLKNLANAPDSDAQMRQLGEWFHRFLTPLAERAYATVIQALTKSQRDLHGVAVGERYLSRRLRWLGKKYPSPDQSQMEAPHA